MSIAPAHLARPATHQRLRLRLDAAVQPNFTTIAQWPMARTVALSIPMRLSATTFGQPVAYRSVAPEVSYKPTVTIQDNSLAVGVTAELEGAGDRLILTDPTTGIFGVGATSADVIRDFVNALRDHADVLAAQKALSPALQRQLAHLRRHLAI